MDREVFKKQPLKISEKEWEEIVGLPEVREGWGLLPDHTGADFASMVYGVKFDFVSGSPGYVGPLFIVQGDALADACPFMLIRRDGQLVPYRP